MKKRSIAALCLCAALLLSACGKAPASSGGQSSSAPQQAPAASAAPEAPSEPVPSASEPAAEVPEEPPVQLSTAPSFISLPVTAPDGSESEKVLVVVYAPEGWVFDQYTTFSRAEVKIAEFPRIWQVADAAAPFSEEMLAPYQSSGLTPGEGDAVSAEDLTLNGSPLRVLHLPTWMDGSEESWFLHCAFYARDGYVVEAHLYTTQEWGGTDSEELLAALGALELHFSEESGA